MALREAPAQTQNEMESRLLLDVIVGKRTTIFQLLSCKDQTLLIWRNAFLVLDLCLHVIDCVAGFDIQSDGFPGQSLHKDLHASTEAKDKMKCGLLLDVIVRKRAAIFQLLSSKNQALLIWRNAFLVLDLRLHVIDRVGGFDIESDGLSGERLHKDLHASTQAKDKMKCGLLLDVIVGKRA